MKVVLAPDSFKECLDAPEVATALAAGWRRGWPEAELVLAPMADGGEGTVAALVAATGGELVELEVTGPLGAPVRARYGRLPGGTAVIEMAAAAGLPLVPEDQRDPRTTTTRGVGELLVHALEAGAREILLGLGGSASNDAGAGFAQALGYHLLDQHGEELPPGGAALAALCTLDRSERHPLLDDCTIRAACDVDNPLHGPRGASAVYGPQKGADAAAVQELDHALANFAAVIHEAMRIDVQTIPGAGAAGGLGAGLVAFAGASLEAGAALVAEASGLREKLRGADLVLSGEGRIDAQTLHGKTPAGVARLAREEGVPVILIGGELAPGYEALLEQGVTAAFSLCSRPMTLAEAKAEAPRLLEELGESLARLWRAARR